MRISSYTVDSLFNKCEDRASFSSSSSSSSFGFHHQPCLAAHFSPSGSFHLLCKIMAALPPRIPPSSVELHHRKSPSLGSLTAALCGGAASEKESWVDDFKDFSWARRGLRRRSMSDSVAFFESGVGEDEEEEDVSEFERFKDGESSFVFQTRAASSSLSEKKGVKMEQEEVESSSCLQEKKTDHPPLLSPSIESITETIVDPKRVKRILANRQSAQRSRVRKLQYISELERSVTSLQTEVSVLSPRVAFLDQQRSILNVDNTALKQRIAVLIQDKIFNDAHEEALRREIERLQKVYNNQNMKTTAPSKEEEEEDEEEDS